MTPSGPLRIGIVGCGNIAGPYARDIVAKPELTLVAATDLDPALARMLTETHGGTAVATLDDLLAQDLDLVVNLTFPAAHASVTRRALEAGKHVHSEKPLARTPSEAWALVELATANGLRLGCSPFTLLGEAQQTAWRAIRDDRVGPVRVVFAEVDWGRIETWHPAPIPFYEVGPLVDVAVYPLSIVTAMLGPARRVRAIGHVVQPNRVTKDGTPYQVTTPDLQIVVLELEGGVVVRLTASFWVGQQSKGFAGLQFHGDNGSLWLDNFFRFDGPVEIAKLGNLEPYVPLTHVRAAPGEFDWARAVQDLAEAITDHRAHRATGEQGAHVIDILDAAERSMAADGAPIEVTSSFSRPVPMPWAE
ncbi:MAG TPA: Gfo/Idh/MocA family oxidoreductase [Candidatus Limnocylindrales bacterium]|nr:Gfo/Idh/MocA family oxidoreductase [Candidatus Limnocylindrales bacterium]